MFCCDALRTRMQLLWLQWTAPTITMTSGFKVQQGQQIAEGGFSFVYEARSGRSRFALKKILCQTPEQLREARHEIAVHNECSHPSLLRLVDHAFVQRGARTEAFLLYPLYTLGTLRNEIDKRLKSGVALDETAMLRCFEAICSGVQHMHAHDPSWAHRDIKPENVLLAEDGTPVLMDFGSVTEAVTVVHSRREALMVQEQAAEGSSMPYRAPELFDVASDARVDARTDVWSLGCLLFAMAFGYSPFECSFTRDGQVRITECSYLRVISEPTFPSPCAASAELCALIRWMLNTDPALRPTVEEVLERVAAILAAPR